MAVNTDAPLVSFVTPVYNGETYLEECIESIRVQTYSNWEYVIVDNQSTDRTREIAEAYAHEDPRIRVHVNANFLPLMHNWNHAVRQISADSKYCKVVHADDWLFPACVTSMVELAENNPQVGIVGSYRLDEDRVGLDGLPYPSTVVSGRDVVRWHFLEGLYLFGSPTSLLLRADLVRSRPKFYNEDNLHADTEVCYDLLRGTDFGFVHQVLTFTRRHNEAVTSTCRRLNTYIPANVYILKKYGPDFLTESEFKEAMDALMAKYYHFLARNLFRVETGRTPELHEEFWTYHMSALKDLGYCLNRFRLYGAVLVAAYNKTLDMLKVA
jgi:glycosyltransferase involved in cell wall biosynthesis